MLLVSDAALGRSALFFLEDGGWERALMDGPRQPAVDDSAREAARLVALMAKGDRTALAQLYDRLAGPVYSLVYRMLGDGAEAQDLSQEVFLQLWTTAETYEPGRGSVFSWVITLARNRAIDRLRMRRRRTELLSGAALDLQPAPLQESDGAATLDAREDSATVRAALAGLPVDQRQAIELAYFSGLTQQEIAARLREPLGTIKARIRRGLLRLRQELPTRP
jgi:RNA polymerase sigma-70 factor (ECF subfamily)